HKRMTIALAEKTFDLSRQSGLKRDPLGRGIRQSGNQDHFRLAVVVEGAADAHRHSAAEPDPRAKEAELVIFADRQRGAGHDHALDAAALKQFAAERRT